LMMRMKPWLGQDWALRPLPARKDRDKRLGPSRHPSN